VNNSIATAAVRFAVRQYAAAFLEAIPATFFAGKVAQVAVFLCRFAAT
jgi:hypothetical protein